MYVSANEKAVSLNLHRYSEGDRLISSLVALQDITAAHGPTEVFFPGRRLLLQNIVASAAAKRANDARPADSAAAAGDEYDADADADEEDVDEDEDDDDELDDAARQYTVRSERSNMLSLRTPWAGLCV